MPQLFSGSGVQVLGQGSALSASNPKGLRGTAIATMQAFADEFGSLLEENGYQMLPNGLIIQWMKGSVIAGSADVSSVLNFPIAFPNAALHVAVTTMSSGVLTDDGMFQLVSYTKQQVTVFKGVFTNNASSLTPMILAIGK